MTCVHMIIFMFKTVKEKGGGGLGVKENSIHGTAAYMLTLPGRVLDISALNSQHKFRDRGKKQGAVDAIQHLEEAGLGVVHKERATRGTALVSVINPWHMCAARVTVIDVCVCARVSTRYQ